MHKLILLRLYFLADAVDVDGDSDDVDCREELLMLTSFRNMFVIIENGVAHHSAIRHILCRVDICIHMARTACVFLMYMVTVYTRFQWAVYY